MIAAQVVGGVVADLAQGVEQIADLRGQEAGVAQAQEQVVLLLGAGGVQAGRGGEPLRQDLAELPELEQRGRGIVGEVTLGQGAQVIQERIVDDEEREVRGAGRGR